MVFIFEKGFMEKKICAVEQFILYLECLSKSGMSGSQLAKWSRCYLGHLNPIIEVLNSSLAHVQPGRQQVMDQVLGSLQQCEYPNGVLGSWHPVADI